MDLAKLEISAKDLDKTTIELNYQIVVKNEGNVQGKVTQVIDYLPKDTVLNAEQSKDDREKQDVSHPVHKTDKNAISHGVTPLYINEFLLFVWFI